MLQELNNTRNDIIIYQAEDGKLSFNVNIFADTVWLTQQQMADLFSKDRKTITWHIGNIFKEGELQKRVVCWEYKHTTKHGAIAGKRQQSRVKYYNLDVIISVGYRVKSKRGTQFRQWATDILKQHMLNGYSVNEKRIKQIESSIEELVTSDQIKTKEIAEIKQLLKSLIARPIIINNLNLGMQDLESKIISLLDEIIEDLKKKKKDPSKLESIKQDVSTLPQNPKAKNPKAKKRLLAFFTEIGDSKSDIHKTIKGTTVAKNIISELVKLGDKLKDFL